MTLAVVLDAGAFDVLGSPRGARMRMFLRRTIDDGDDVRCAAVTLAEVCRGTARTRQVEAALARRHGGRRIRVVPTDERLAKLVGAILHGAGRGSGHIADAHVVAICAAVDNALVLTTDPLDIAALADAVPGTRIVTRDPESPLP